MPSWREGDWHGSSMTYSLRGLLRSPEEQRAMERGIAAAVRQRDLEIEARQTIDRNIRAGQEHLYESAHQAARDYEAARSRALEEPCRRVNRTPIHLDDEYVNHLIDQRLRDLGLYPHLRQLDGNITINGEATINRDNDE